MQPNPKSIQKEEAMRKGDWVVAYESISNVSAVILRRAVIPDFDE